MDHKQQALAAEIRAEMAARSPRLTATEMQQRTGIKHASWRNWFVTASRPVPYPSLVKVADALGVELSQLIRRAEERAARTDNGVDELMSGLSPRNQRIVEETRIRPNGGGNGSAEQTPDTTRQAESG